MVGLIGLILVLEATRRSIGLIVPLLALAFVAHSYYCYGSFRYDWPVMPDWMLPHAGQSVKDIVSTTFLQSLGVFGPAASVMFKYVFLFVVFGSFLEMSGATQFIIDFATKTFGRIRGGPAMVSVMASGLMGSLSGSAVANAVTTGTFTIPMMRSARFPNHIAGGITAAAASGGALVPPVMGAGAYMMLELVQPQVTFVTIMKAAILPAMLYYLSILAVVYLYSRRLGAAGLDTQEVSNKKLNLFRSGCLHWRTDDLSRVTRLRLFPVPQRHGSTGSHPRLRDAATRTQDHVRRRAGWRSPVSSLSLCCTKPRSFGAILPDLHACPAGFLQPCNHLWPVLGSIREPTRSRLCWWLVPSSSRRLSACSGC